MKVTIGIPTYNRRDLLETMARSLYKSDLGIAPNIRIYDDCSMDYNKEFLERTFPTAMSIKVNPSNLKSDKNIYQMYVDFISTDDDYFFNADADIIFNSQWLNKGLEMIKKTDGVLSLFNANSHQAYRTIDDEFCLKKTMGSAGMLFSRERVIEIIGHFDSIEKVKGFDWQWSDYFSRNKILMYCLNNSLVQHIGYDGQNSHLYFDFGKNYKIESIEDGQIINDIFEKSIDNVRFKEKERVKQLAKINAELANNFKFHFKRCIVIIIKKIMPRSMHRRLKKIY